MDVILRLLLRFLLVPLGYLAAVLAGACVILFGSWRFGEVFMSSHPDAFAYGLFGFAVAGPVLFVMLLSLMWLPGAVGILISEAFAIRSWIFHALNGAASAWVGWQMFAAFDKSEPADERAEIRRRGGTRRRLRLLGGGRLERGLLEAGVPAHANCRRPPRDPFNPPAQTKA